MKAEVPSDMDVDDTGTSSEQQRISAAPGQEVPPAARRLVLVADSDREAAASMSMFLTDAGYELIVAHDGPAALEAARRHRPDLALIELALPVLDGYELAGRIRQDARLDATALVAVAGYSQFRDRDRLRKAGFDHHLVKPLNYASLVGLLEGQSESDPPPAPQRSLPQPAENEPAPHPIAASDSMTPMKLLLIDDSRPVAEVSASILEELGYQVEVAYDGPQALAAIDRFQPAVVICDINLGGGMSGYDVARAIRARSADPQPILIAVTAHTPDQVGHRAKESGFDLQLTKPVDFEDLPRLLSSRIPGRDPSSVREGL